MRSRRMLGLAFLALVPVVPLLGIIIVTGYFRLGSDSVALRQSLMTEVNGTWHKKFVIHVGPLTTALARFCSQWINMPQEPKAALQAIHAAEVGIYNLQNHTPNFNPGAILARADKAMSSRGWERVVGVCREQELVTLYLPRRNCTPQRLKCCLLVYQTGQLIVVSARGDLEPLLEIVRKQVNLQSPFTNGSELIHLSAPLRLVGSS